MKETKFVFFAKYAWTVPFLFLFFFTRKNEDHSKEIMRLNNEKLERDDRIMEQSKEVSLEATYLANHLPRITS